MNLRFDILFVEDEKIIVGIAEKILHEAGFSVDAAADAETAFDKWRQNVYRVLIADLMLPNVSGIELMKRVKMQNPDIPVIIISGYATVEIVIEAFTAGAFDFLAKPFDENELLGVVRRGVTYLDMLKGRPEKSPGFMQEKKHDAEKVYFLGKHSWTKADEKGLYVVGLGETFSGVLQEIREVVFPEIGSEILQGRSCVRLVSEQLFEHVVLSPLSGKVVAVDHKLQNESKQKNINLLRRRWLLKLLPTNLTPELMYLTDAKHD